MNQENESTKKLFQTLSAKYKIPYRICLALQGDEERISFFAKELGNVILNDLYKEDKSKSFLRAFVLKKTNIDGETGKAIDIGFHYDYLSELHHTDRTRQRLALQKVLCGLTGSSLILEKLKISQLSNNGINILSDYFYTEIRNSLDKIHLTNALMQVDENHIKDLKNGVFYFSSSVKHIANMSVLKLLNIHTVILPYGVTVIEAHAFENSGIRAVTFSKTVSHIKEKAFYNCQLTKVVLPDNKYLTSLGEGAFARNPQLTEVKLPKEMELVDMKAFEDCPITKIFASENLKAVNQTCKVELHPISALKRE